MKIKIKFDALIFHGRMASYLSTNVFISLYLIFNLHQMKFSSMFFFTFFSVLFFFLSHFKDNLNFNVTSTENERPRVRSRTREKCDTKLSTPCIIVMVNWRWIKMMVNDKTTSNFGVWHVWRGCQGTKKNYFMTK